MISQQNQADITYIADELNERTGEKVRVNSIRLSLSQQNAGRLIAVVEIGNSIVAGAGASINQLIDNIYERYTS